MPIFGHTYFDHNSAIFGQIGLKIFMGTQETFIYRLLIENQSCDPYLSFLNFLGHFWRENGRVHHARSI